MNIPPEFRQRIKEWIIIFDLVNSYFEDEKKTSEWFFTENPLLGGVSPDQMIKLGRFEKLKTFVKQQLEGNSP
jgi:hypothetical protein